MSQVKTKKTNFYLTLDLMPGANHNDILHAYNRAKSTYTTGSLASYTLLEGDSNSSILEEIEEAFAVLGNPSKRRVYDLEMGYNTWAEEPGVDPKGNEFDLQQMMRSSSTVKKGDGASMSTAGGHAGSASSSQSSAKSSSSRSVQAAARGAFGSPEANSDDARVIPMKSNTSNNSSSRESATPFGSTTASQSVTPKTQSSTDGFFEPNPEFERKIQECKEVTGPFLKAVRIYRGLSPDMLATRCKLSVTHVSALENEEHAPSQAPVYLRGHIYLVCQALDLPDPNALAKAYVERMSAEGKLQRRNF